MKHLENRPTTDVVIILLTVMVVVVVACLVVASILILLISPNANIAPIIKSVSDTITVIVGALIGFVGGRATKGEQPPTDEGAPDG